jgi:hypothetical protein
LRRRVKHPARNEARLGRCEPATADHPLRRPEGQSDFGIPYDNAVWYSGQFHYLCAPKNQIVRTNEEHQELLYHCAH